MNEKNETQKVILFILGAVALVILLAFVASGCAATPRPASVALDAADPTSPAAERWVASPANNWLRVTPPGPTWRVTAYGSGGEQPRALAVAFDEWDGALIRFDRLSAPVGASPARMANDILAGTMMKPAMPPMTGLRTVAVGDEAPMASFAYQAGGWYVQVIVTRLRHQPEIMLMLTGKCRPEHAATIEDDMLSSLKNAAYY